MAAARTGLTYSISTFVDVLKRHGAPIVLNEFGLRLFVVDRSQSCKASTIRLHLEKLEILARATAESDKTLQALRLLRRAFNQRAKRASRRKDLVVLPDSQRVLSLASCLLDEARQRRPDDVQSAKAFQTGFMLLLLCFYPVRISNLRDLRLRDFTAKHADHLFIGGDAVKNEADLDFPLHQSVKEVLEEYWKTWRPILAGRTMNDDLWVYNGRKICSVTIRQRIALITSKHFGIRITPHNFRDIAATTAITLAPDQPRIASAMLGHLSPTSLAAYVQRGASIAASREMQKLMSRVVQTRCPASATSPRRGM
jgi:integrase